jgi:hypothetical protein
MDRVFAESRQDMRIGKGILLTVLAACIAIPGLSAAGADKNAAAVTAQWTEVEGVSATVPTTQILAHAFTLRTHALHDPLFRALRNLHTQDTRLQLWFSVTNSAVPELKEPTATETFWDFRYMDALVADYYANTTGRHHVNMGTIPRWMFKVPAVELPSDPGASFYAYTEGTSGDLLKDPTGKQFAEYQARLYQWYTQGGFTDEVGKFHKSGHYYKIDYWGVLNEPDFENKITVEQYTKIYDAVTTAIHKIDPEVQFFGPEVSGAEVSWARYFLDPKNHDPQALPVAWFAFHNYVNAPNDPATWHARYFTDPQAGPTDGSSARAFAERIREVMAIRDELSPQTRLIVDELGVFNIVKPGEEACRAPEPYTAFHPLYWNANGANWAVNFITAEKLGLPLMSVSQMAGYPTQCPSIAMFDPETAQPNAHYWVLSLVNRNFGPGDKLVRTESNSEDVVAQAAITPGGRKVLLVNTTERGIEVDLSGAFEVPDLMVHVVDLASGEQEPRMECLSAAHIKLAPFAVAVVSQ